MSDIGPRDFAPQPVAELGIGPPPATQLDAEAAAPADPFAAPPADVDQAAADVDPEVVRAILEGIGDLLATASDELTFYVLLEPGAEEQWKFTDSELSHLTPIITRMVNARPAWRSAAKHGDEMALAMQLAPYLARNAIAGWQAKAARFLALNAPEEWERGDLDRQAAQAAPGPDGDARERGGRPEPGDGPEVGAGIGSPAF